MDYTTLAAPDSVQRTMEAVKTRGITAEFVESKEAVLGRLRTLIPPGVTLSTGASVTLRQIGFEDLLKSGDVVSITGYRARFSQNRAAGREVTLADGRKVFLGPAA